MQTLVLHRFGIFPWECTGCRKVFNAMKRGKVKRPRQSNGNGVVKLPPSLNGSISRQLDF